MKELYINNSQREASYLLMRNRFFPVLRPLASLLVASGVSAAIQFLPRRFLPREVSELVAAAIFLRLYVAGARWIERRRAVELSPDRSALGILEGLVFGIVLFSCVMGILRLAGVYSPGAWGRWQPLGLALLSALEGAVFEETVFRGFLFRSLARFGDNWIALGVTATLFSLAHVGKPGATWVSGLAGFAAGILFGAAFASRSSLWLPIGIHAGWNFAEGPVFGMEVSGNARPVGWIGGQLHGPAILTGGAFGPEASIAAVVVCSVLAAFYLRKMRRAD
jgi:membrane protease YdiL (CAAX protease family)